MAEDYKKVFTRRFYPLFENISCRNCAAFQRGETNVLPILELNETTHKERNKQREKVLVRYFSDQAKKL